MRSENFNLQILVILFFSLIIKNGHCFFGKTNLFNTHEELEVNISDIDDTLKSTLDSEKVKEKWISQKLNNYDMNDERTWKMRYFENSEFFRTGGPIFIYVGGEWTISPKWLTTGHMFDMAKELNGIMFYTEHRYYGKSRPTKDTSSENLKYLSVHQALADLANFIKYVKNSNSSFKNSGVILIGASYSATVATWARLKYPELVDGVWASSAPLFAKIDFFEYNEIMTQSIRKAGGEKCLERLKNAYIQLESYFAYSEPKFLYKIQKDFNLCEPLKLCRDTAHFFYETSDTIAGLVQKHRYDSIQKACDFITQDKFADDMEAFGAWISSRSDKGCIDMNYDNIVKKFTNITWESEGNQQLRQWIYQACDTFGWFQSGTSLNQAFGSKHPQIGYFVQMCQDFYGSRFDENSIIQSTHKINEEFRGFEPQVTNVYSTHGYLDPWKAMGAQKDLHKSSPTTILKDYSHCADLYTISNRDSPEMKKSKMRIKNLVKAWLNLK